MQSIVHKERAKVETTLGTHGHANIARDLREAGVSATTIACTA